MPISPFVRKAQSELLCCFRFFKPLLKYLMKINILKASSKYYLLRTSTEGLLDPLYVPRCTSDRDSFLSAYTESHNSMTRLSDSVHLQLIMVTRELQMLFKIALKEFKNSYNLLSLVQLKALLNRTFLLNKGVPSVPFDIASLKRDKYLSVQDFERRMNELLSSEFSEILKDSVAKVKRDSDKDPS